MPVFVGVAVLSAAVIGYEILLTRLFSIIQWHHFAHMVISLALLGFGTAGTVVALAQEVLLRHFSATFGAAAAAFGVSAFGSFALAQRVPFNALEIAWGGAHLAWLLVLYLLLALPFFFAASAVCLAFLRFKDRVGALYRIDLVGAGLGAPALVLLLWFVPLTSVLKLLALAGVVAGAVGLLPALRRPVPLVISCSLLVIAAALPFAAPDDWSALRLSPYKGLSSTLTAPDARIIATRSGPLGALAVVESPIIPLRHAPGLSLLSQGAPPQQLGIYTDGGSLSAMTRFDGELAPLAYLGDQTAALPYHLLNAPRVLVLGAGGGSEVLRALFHGARRIDAVELDANMVALVGSEFAGFTGNLYDREPVRVHIEEARIFVARSSDDFDLIQLSLVDTFTAASAGVHALNESTLYTVEALRSYLERLAPEGILAVTRWLKVPPRDALKLVATARLVLEEAGVQDPGARIALVRGWKTTTLLVKNGVLNEADVVALQRFAEERAFDLAWYPGMPASEANRYNRLTSPYFYEGVVALLGPDSEQFMEDYKFALRPATDNRPYFFNSFKWTTLPELLALPAGGGVALAEWGYIVLTATLVQAAIVSVVLILLPLLAGRVGQGAGAVPWGRGRLATYFLALGLGFLFIEIAFIQRFVLFLGHPVYAIALVLASFLVFAGLGSGMADRLAAAFERRRFPAGPLAPVSAGIVVLAGFYVGVLPALFEALLPWPDWARIAVAVLLIAPLAFLMGLPFPLGLRRLASEAPSLIPWAWGINGCASVLSAVLATLLAIHFGFGAVVACAIGLYALAAVLFAAGGGGRQSRRSASPRR